MPRRLTDRRSVVLLIAILLGFAVVGALCGVLWEWWWSPAKGVVQDNSWYPISWDRAQPAEFSATGWYVAISIVAGLLLGALAAWRADRWPLVTLVTVVVGGLVGAVLMRVVGSPLSPADPNVLANTAADGTFLPSNLVLPSWWLIAAMPGAALAGLALVFLLVSGREAEAWIGEQARLSEQSELSSPE